MCKAHLGAIFTEEAVANSEKVPRSTKEFISMASTQPIPKQDRINCRYGFADVSAGRTQLQAFHAEYKLHAKGSSERGWANPLLPVPLYSRCSSWPWRILPWKCQVAPPTGGRTPAHCSHSLGEDRVHSVKTPSSGDSLAWFKFQQTKLLSSWINDSVVFHV